MSVPLSFDFTGEAIRPDHVLKCSYGNDSIALIQWAYEYQTKYGSLGKIVVLYNETGWAANWWEGRVLNGENLVQKYGMIPARTLSIGMEKLIKRHNTWPDRFRRFCTEELKIIPTWSWLAQHDPEGKAVMLCGVRREESAARRMWPEWVESSDKNEGRAEWSPLVLLDVSGRDELIQRAGWQPLPHRSRECRCVLANSQDISTWSEEDIVEIERLEAIMNHGNRGENKFHFLAMFHPHRKKGNPVGIRAVVEWAKAVQATKQEDLTDLEPTGCDSGFCSA
jgi:3'-phosphoadenosine 5'-phosphosulfate sulfotransferase (PAPS reductase)/FAD synthetase